MKFYATKPDEMKFTLEISMTLGDWKKLKDQLVHKQEWPGWSLEDEIQDLISQAERDYFPKAADLARQQEKE